MRIDGRVVGTTAALVALERAHGRSLAGAAVGLERAALQGVGRVQGNTSGRPGPNVITGDYRRSWTADTDFRPPDVLQAQIGTNAAQGPRLENGFTGTDVLGRTYDQPPYPHVRPAVPEITADAERLVAGAVRVAL